MRKAMLAALCLTIAAPALGQEILRGRLQVIDGDTLWHYAPRAQEPEKIRLLDIDAPESQRSSCEKELIAGLRAKARLLELVSVRPVSIERCNIHSHDCEDRFGRTLARIRLADGREAGAVLLAEKLALRYVRGKKAERDAFWCGG